MDEQATLRERFHDLIREAKMVDIRQLEVPEKMFRLFFETGSNVTFQDIRIFVEGTMEKTIAYEGMTVEQRIFERENQVTK